MNYVILGASAAGINAAKTLRSLDKTGEITIVSKDKNVYSRCMLHLYVSKKRDIDSLSFIEKDFFQKNNINWIKGVSASSINTRISRVFLDNGSSIEYDKLLIATGSSAVIPPVENLREAKNVFTLRNLEDSIAIDKASLTSKAAVVIGGGLIGIDMATELLERGIRVFIVEMGKNILPLQLDEKTAKTYELELQKRGATIFTDHLAKSALLDEKGNLKGLLLEDGTVIDADMAIVAAGVKANADFIGNTNIEFDKGIIVNSKCETKEVNIYAAGDVCAGKPGIWPLAVKQGIVAAHNMANREKEIDSLFGFKNSMNFFGIDTVSIGVPNPQDDSFNVHLYDDGKVYKKIIEKDGIIYGAIFQGDISYTGVYTKLISEKISIKNINKSIFNIGYADFFNITPKGEFQYK
ncbi:NAD(P)/FAD-dependent oxidoreductase [Clostridium butanoliproducens]|uniref:NAD(P)/FAD-dependent oxidoreductase n=1 Tax=Clostridium butanoliproducens TaxID=2991837 RepID=UPI0024B8BF09|nr:FAD-dependent oxidoreductase [Clostridium butanoliproducens]